MIDIGTNWPANPSPITGCSYSNPRIIINPGHGTFLLRTDGDQAEYKMVTIREIDITQSCSVLAVMSASSAPEIIVSPNPNNGNFTIRIPKASSIGCRFSITDIHGKEVFTADASQISEQIELSGLKPGVYFVRFQTSDGVIVKKFLAY